MTVKDAFKVMIEYSEYVQVNCDEIEEDIKQGDINCNLCYHMIYNYKMHEKLENMFELLKDKLPEESRNKYSTLLTTQKEVIVGIISILNDLNAINIPA